MPAYASHVQRMTTGSASERGAGLANLGRSLGDLSEEQLLEVVREPGLLAALNPLLWGDRSLTALKVLFALMGRDSNPSSRTLHFCGAAILESPCFPSLKELAASGSTLKHKREAWEAIRGVSRLEEGRLLDSPGMVELLQVGLKGADHSIAKHVTATIHNLCTDETTATAIFESPCFPSLKDIAASGGTPELKRNAYGAIRNVSCMEEGRLREFFDSPGMVALLKDGLESPDTIIADDASATFYNLCCDETTASAVLDGHPDLVQTLVITFCNSGVGDHFSSKSQLHSFFPLINSNKLSLSLFFFFQADAGRS